MLKISRAKTDTGPTKIDSKPLPEVQNLFDLMKIVSDENTLTHFTDAYANCSIRYGDMKKQLAEDMITFLTPIREKIEAISNDTSYLGKVAKLGAEKAHDSATKTINEVREVIGFRKFY